MRTKTIPSFACGVMAWQSLEAAQQPRASAQSAPDSASERAFLDKYCVTCHSDKLHTGGLSLQSIDTSNVPAGAEIWEKVIRKIRGGAMPPQEMPRPDKAALDAFVSGIENTIDRAAAGKPNPGRAVLTGPAPIAKLAQDGGDCTLAAGATPFSAPLAAPILK